MSEHKRKRKASDVTTVSASLKKKKATTAPTTGKRKASTDDAKSAKRAATARPVERTHIEKPTSAAEPSVAQPPSTTRKPTRDERIMAILDNGDTDLALSETRKSLKRYNADSYIGTVNNIRRKYASTRPMPEPYMAGLTALHDAVNRSSADTRDAVKFLDAPFTEQRGVIRDFIKDVTKRISTDELVQVAFHKLYEHRACSAPSCACRRWRRGMPHPACCPAFMQPNIQNYVNTSGEYKDRKDEVAKKLQRSQTVGLRVIRKGDEVINWCVQLFQQHNKNLLEPPRLLIAAALLLVTGRRSIEILSGMSRFTQFTESNPYHVFFDGQAKQMGDVGPFCIQTLLPFSLWHPSYRDYFESPYGERNRQLCREDRKTEVQRDVNKHSTMLGKIATRTLGTKLTAHQLRDVYSRMAFEMFRHTSTASFNAFQMAMLGHEQLNTSLHYQGVTVEGLTYRLPDKAIPIDYASKTRCAEPDTSTSNVTFPMS